MPASITADAVKERYRDKAEVTLLNGFSPKQYFSRLWFEGGYHISNVCLRGAYSLFYDINTIPFFLNLTTACVSFRTIPYLAEYIKRYNITKIVCFHFAVAPAAWQAIQKSKRNIPFVIAVTDPFTPHPAWFLIKQARFIVFSEKVRRLASEQFGIRDVSVFPFVMRKEFRGGACRPAGKKPFHILIAGGGEGLAGMIPLVSYFAKKSEACGLEGAQPLMTITAVCGRNKNSLKKLKRIAASRPRFLLNPIGYAENMPELINEADCVISKAGASSVMEILSCCKPVIFCNYIHGQELGNVRFAAESGAGWLIRKPKDIYHKILQLMDKPELYRQAAENAASLRVCSNLDSIARFIYEA